jgi:hypothetical protein
MEKNAFESGKYFHQARDYRNRRSMSLITKSFSGWDRKIGVPGDGGIICKSRSFSTRMEILAQQKNLGLGV